VKNFYIQTRVEQPEQADLLIINTCSIREKSQNKVFSALGRWRDIQKKRPDVCIAVAGCVASQMAEEIIDRMPYVNLVFGPQTLQRLPNMLQAFAETGKPQIDVSFPVDEKFDHLPAPKTEGPTAFVSIMEGCNKFCTYCVVPFTRGREWSRSVEDVLLEVSTLASQGVREVTLLGQNVNAYRGRAMESEACEDLVHLIEKISNIDEVLRIRYTTSHPAEFSERLIEAYREFPKLVSHIHLPVQSGSDAILKKMHRGYTAADYLRKVEHLKCVKPGISISTDIIVGFPGESDEDFEATLRLVNEVQFDHSFSFIYSPRPGTRAEKFEDTTPLQVKKQRLATLQSLLNEYAMQISHSMVGSEQKVLVSAPSKKSHKQYSGRTENNRVVNFDGDESLIGHLVTVRITEALPNSLRGILIDSGHKG
jgi:tRNA-2-methylthio-N6-dimethylallyladenosine synthase